MYIYFVTVSGGHFVTVSGGHFVTVCSGHFVTACGRHLITVYGGIFVTVCGGNFVIVCGSHYITVCLGCLLYQHVAAILGISGQGFRGISVGTFIAFSKIITVEINKKTQFKIKLLLIIINKLSFDLQCKFGRRSV